MWVKIYDLYGRAQTIKYRGTREIDISSFCPGAYWVYLKTRSRMEITKLIVL
ncbi:MAG: T9SS type A sorting domain-containing protein [Saprospiraceae bacterium]|nr:T9SS type A sorting domain-containing protein [Saprospiraceae bacterium]